MKARKNGDTIFPYKPSKFPYQTSEQSETMTGEGDGELYMPDIDIKSMFLRYDNRLNRKRYILRSITVAFPRCLLFRPLCFQSGVYMT